MKKILLFVFLIAFGSKASNAQCNANFTFSLISSGAPLVGFTNFSNGDSLSPLSFSWDFGDGSPIDTLTDPVHQYPSYGVYTVCLIMSDTTGCTDTLCMPINVQQPAPSISNWFMTDSTTMYACTAPLTVSYFYSANTQNFSVPDTIFNVLVVWGDGSDTTWTITGLNASMQGVLTHAYVNAGIYTAQMTISETNTQVTSSSTGQPVTVSSTCGPLTGSVYNDLNSNCIFDAGEELGNVIVTINNGSQLIGWTQTDSLGGYSFNVDTTLTYDLILQPNNGQYGMHTPTCPASGIINGVTVPSSGNDFGVACPVGADLTGTLTGWLFRPGFTATICVNAYNIRCTTPSGQIEITVDSLLTPLPDTTSIGYTVNGQIVTFPFNAPDLNWNFCFPVTVSLSAQIGDTVCMNMNIIAPGDSVIDNNISTHCFPIRNSFDPNDKYGEPAGVNSQGYILPNTPITYTIRFQNTGNDVAYNIYILDTIDQDLDIMSLEVMGASHAFNYSVLSGNILRVNFDNIMLADSNANEPASHGYVTYRINQLSSVAQGAEINNTAGIYFDFNSPIITNTTLHTIDYFLSVPVNVVNTNFSVYPNPAYDKCMVRFNDNSLKTISLNDALGREVFRSQVSSMIEINTSQFAPGIYTIRVNDNSGINNSTIIVGIHCVPSTPNSNDIGTWSISKLKESRFQKGVWI